MQPVIKYLKSIEATQQQILNRIERSWSEFQQYVDHCKIQLTSICTESKKKYDLSAPEPTKIKITATESERERTKQRTQLKEILKEISLKYPSHALQGNALQRRAPSVLAYLSGLPRLIFNQATLGPRPSTHPLPFTHVTCASIPHQTFGRDSSFSTPVCKAA